MKNKHPILSYRGSIWLFSFLLLVLFAVFSIGTTLNLLQMGSHWRRSEFSHFMSTSSSIMALLQETETGNRMLEGQWNDFLISRMRQMMQAYDLNTSDEVFLVFHDSVKMIFPEIKELEAGESGTELPETWRKGWRGISSMSEVYTRADGREVMAAIRPGNYNEAGPGVIMVVERETRVFNRIGNRINYLIAFSIIGLIFAYILVLYYGRKMLQPYSRLETILMNAENLDSKAVQQSETLRDPVKRAIETFDEAIKQLQEQESRLENLSKQLEHPELTDSDIRDDLLDTVNAGIVTFDTDLTVKSFTSRVPELLNLERERINGRSGADVFGYESMLFHLVTSTLKSNRGIQQRLWNWNLPGQDPRWFNLSTTLIRSAQKKIIGVGCVIRDITVMKRLESQIREKEHLAALGELSAGIAHEFRNPLGAILGNAQYLVKEIQTNELAEVARDIRDEVIDLERIIRDFLNFARPFHPEVSDVDLVKLFKEESLSIQQDYDSKVEIEIDSKTEEKTLQLDENLFRQVIRNALLNACQVMHGEGRIRVEITAPELSSRKTAPQRKPNWMIRITDEGPGVLPEHNEMLFKPFFSKREGGTGLGLAIVKKIVLIHNGFVEFEHKNPPGAVLRIIIPGSYDPDQTLVVNQFPRHNSE
jgi:signal transduction histidine kinase